MTRLWCSRTPVRPYCPVKAFQKCRPTTDRCHLELRRCWRSAAACRWWRRRSDRPNVEREGDHSSDGRRCTKERRDLCRVAYLTKPNRGPSDFGLLGISGSSTSNRIWLFKFELFALNHNWPLFRSWYWYYLFRDGIVDCLRNLVHEARQILIAHSWSVHVEWI